MISDYFKNNKDVIDILTNILAEDIKDGDVTTDSIVSDKIHAKALITAKSEGIVCGLPLISMIFNLLNPAVEVFPKVQEGDFVEKGTDLVLIEGPAKAILTGERTVLNLLQRMSGIATKTCKLSSLIMDYKAQLIDTRKTTPGIRLFEKYAVKIGGAENHRFGLYDMYLIKDNHIKIAGGIKEAIKLAKMHNSKNLLIEIETKNLQEVQEALEEGVDRIMLDNMDTVMMTEAVKLVENKIPLEASGGITHSTIVPVAATGVDYISVGALTHSFESMDISLNITDLI